MPIKPGLCLLRIKPRACSYYINTLPSELYPVLLERNRSPEKGIGPVQNEVTESKPHLGLLETILIAL